ncbi:DUF354 domain-containing protein [Thermococcus sp. 18S1]|uniref:DUF354 domain-containing protein n=1 Tax=Thermococcus sp. 18S1 TaxID=1638210 RepID=UPI00143B2588|nr:DUF354 domain-containing protein [Thermococcus sp. 18S1]NJE30330.1 DUF354 domain-containing protein [Thermococcus sp. 18S1]
MGRKYDLWIDISNTPQVHIARAIVSELNGYSIYITGFKRGETVELMEMFGLPGEVVGSDRYNPFLKSLSFANRALLLLFKAPRARALLNFGNATSIPTSKLRRSKVILMLDNDLKFVEKKSIFLRIESNIERFTDYVIVPNAAEDVFQKFFKNVITYPGYKEHLYIADFEPNPNFVQNLPFKEYIVVRPESLTSLYVLHNKSLVPELMRLFEKEGINVIYLPRNDEERKLAKGFKNVYIPPKALDGLNLIYYSKATLTGSGTMAREAAVIGVPAVSFFPGGRLLAVDKDLVKRGKMMHSREPEEIVEYIVNSWDKKREGEFEKAQQVRKHVIHNIQEIIGD